MKARWLITGAGGFLGSQLCRQFMTRGINFVAQVREHQPDVRGVETVIADFMDKGSGRKLVREVRPDVVIHCAALTNVDACEREPLVAQRVNADVCGEIAEGCREHGARLVMISTDQLWRAATPWIREDLPPDPAGVYGQTKAAGERYSSSFSDHLILRTNFFGHGPARRPSLSDLVLQTVREGNVFTGFDDVYYTPIDVTLAVQWIIDSINHGLLGTYHLAGRDRLSKYEFARRLAERAGYSSELVHPISVSTAGLVAARPTEMSLDCGKIVRALGRPVPSIEESIERCLSEAEKRAMVVIPEITTTAGGTFLPYGHQSIDDDDIAAVVGALKSDFLTTGPIVDEFEDSVKAATGAKHAVVVNSGTAALFVAAASIGLGPGDWIIAPAMTFCATANGARHAGAEVQFADIDAMTGLITPETLLQALTAARAAKRKVKAVFVVHYAGLVADMVGIKKIADAEGLVVVEDACHAIGGRYAIGNGLTSDVGDCALSQAACFSFHPVKTVAMGEGGAITTNDDSIARRARLFRNHGIERDPLNFAVTGEARDEDGRPNPWYYEMQELGYNFRAPDILCALGLSQMSKLSTFVAKRRGLAAYYDRRLAHLAPRIARLGDMPNCTPAWHLFVVFIDFERLGISRADLMHSLRAQGVGSQVHYIPVPSLPYYRGRGGAEGPFPGAHRFYSQCLSLPLFASMSTTDVDRVVSSLETILDRGEACCEANSSHVRQR